MKLDTEFYKLPLRFDAARLAEEVLQFTEEEWRAHPQGHAGNSALPLVSVQGAINDSVRGPMQPTPFLQRCPYVQQVLASLGTVIGRARLMRIAGEADATPHVDTNYYWMHHVRVHIPAVTYPEVQFLCEDKAVNMAAGEAWIFDSWKLHNVVNPMTAPRIHIVADTVGSAHFWDELVAKAERPFATTTGAVAEQVYVPFVPGQAVTLPLETRNFPIVMSPWEQETLAGRMFADLDPRHMKTAGPLREKTRALHREWFGLWTEFGETRAGWERFKAELAGYDAELASWQNQLSLFNGVDLVEALRQAIVRPALTPELANPTPPSPAPQPVLETPKPTLTMPEPKVKTAPVEAAPAATTESPATAPDAAPPAPAAPVELTSVHTSNLPELLKELGISLLVTTYQAGRLIVLREQAGTLNTHFRGFMSPMGLAYDGARLAIGTKREVWQFHNQTDVAPKLDPVNTHDAAFLPRSCHFTGDIRIHEMAYVGTELWAVNTRFSCLCTFDSEHSFVPRWRPPFVSALAPEDRCHLNGMAVVDDAVKYVTCLGQTDTAGGWRENKASGGLLLQVPSGEIMTSGLSMPHSPRVYGGHLWILESGEGTLSRVEPETGKTQIIAQMPGFTRGLDFFGPYAFIGLSQVRETAIFSGLPLTERLPESERTCGVWVIDLRNGQTVAFLRFESGVQEIFAIQVLPGIRQPDVITDDEEVLASSFVLPEESLREVPRQLLAQPGPESPEPAITSAKPDAVPA
jgi:uncharacterized protein (TIGR03032 family)